MLESAPSLLLGFGMLSLLLGLDFNLANITTGTNRVIAVPNAASVIPQPLTAVDSLVANALNSTLELDEVMDLILASVHRVIPHDRICVTSRAP